MVTMFEEIESTPEITVTIIDLATERIPKQSVILLSQNKASLL